jgi:hypothetical protein
MLVQSRLENWAGRKSKRAATARAHQGSRATTDAALDGGRMR